MGGTQASEAIVFVPALGEEKIDQSPRLIADKLIRSLRVHPRLKGLGALSAQKIPSLVFDRETWKEAEGARLIADDAPLYDLYKYDYRDRLDMHRDLGTARRALSILGSAVGLTIRLARAFNPLKQLKRPTRLQALAAVAIVLVMWLTLLALTSGLWWKLSQEASGLSFEEWEPFRITNEMFSNFDAMLASVTTMLGLPLAATVASLRDVASRYAGAVDYLNHPDDNEYREDLLALVRELERAGYSRVHAVGYSFGALILIDTLFVHRPPDRAETEPAPSPFASVSTIGCVFDFVKTFWPEYFRDRVAPATIPHWVNIYSSDDVLGSRIEEKQLAEGLRPAPPSGAEGICHQVSYRESSKPLGFLQYLLQTGFVNHGCYWTNHRDETDVWRLVAEEGFLHSDATVAPKTSGIPPAPGAQSGSGDAATA